MVQIQITKDYKLEHFREFIQKILLKTGIEGKQITFIFNDMQIIHETFLEDINNLLNSGEIPNLWENEQKDQIINDIRPFNDELKRNNERDTIYFTFVERVRNLLHIVLCMSPVGDNLRIRCRKFPSLVDCCTLNYFSEWPKEALISVANQLLEDYELPTPEIKVTYIFLIIN